MTADNRSLLGASLLNAAGSMPLHLSPLIVAVLMADGVDTILAGGSRAVVLIGQLITAIGLPLFNSLRLNRRHSLAGAAMMIVGLGISVDWLLAGWFIVGMGCGVLTYLAVLTAAVHSRPNYAFNVRLGVTMFMAGAAATVFNLMPLTTYSILTVVLVALLVMLLTVGVSLQLPLDIPAPKRTTKSESGFAWLTLGFVFLLAAGQSGVLAYSLQQANHRGMTLMEVLWALVIIKLVSGVGLLLLRKHKISVVLLGGLLAVADLTVDNALSVVPFVAGLLVLDITFNLLTSKVQALAAGIAPVLVGKWTQTLILIGSASGTMVAAQAIESNLPFVYAAILSALLPMLLINKFVRVDGEGGKLA